MSTSTIDHLARPGLVRTWVARAVVVAALAALIITGIAIGMAATASSGARAPAKAPPPVGEQVVSRAPDLPGYVGLPKGMDGP
jgi:hypothetical protein